MLLSEVARVSAAVSNTPSRTAKIALIAELLRDLEPDQAATAVSWLSGELPQRQIGVGWASLRDLPVAATEASLTVGGVDETLSLIKSTSGSGSQGRRRSLLEGLFAAATVPEQQFLAALLSGELRQGALHGVMTAALAKSAEVPLDAVRRAAMLSGSLAEVAEAVLAGGEFELAAFRLRVGRAVGPMLAQTATDVDDALGRLGGRAAIETKLDGIRVQVHRDGGAVRIFTRSLDEVTARLPEVVAAALSLAADSVVLDGEVLALRPDGRPAAFQVTASRVGTSSTVPAETSVPLSVRFFDILHLDGADLLDAPASARAEVLTELVPPALRVARRVTDDATVASQFLAQALQSGHEGVVVKSLTAPYEAGRRGAGWLKVKPVHTLDLVVLAVEHGSGRRAGTLSNIHLGARDQDGGFVMLGKTFKGMTDTMLAWQTERFTSLADGPTAGYVVQVRPEQVVEIAFDGVQRSTRYPGGVALRFARVLRYRDDKRADEADSIDTVRAFLV